MRLVSAFVLLLVFCLSPIATGQDRASAFFLEPQPDTTLAQRAKIVCGDDGTGYRCRSEGGAIRRGKMPSIPDNDAPGAPSDGSSGAPLWGGGGLWGGGSLWGGNKNEAPAASPSGGTATGGTAAGGCPPNSELLGGHCIPYKQTCSRGLAANAPPQACRSAQEKLVCDFRADGLKDCCCRVYSQN